MTFGIPLKEFPTSLDGKVKFAYHKKWMERREKRERYQAANPYGEIGVDIPSQSDVLLGRGSPYVSISKSDSCFAYISPPSSVH